MPRLCWRTADELTALRAEGKDYYTISPSGRRAVVGRTLYYCFGTQHRRGFLSKIKSLRRIKDGDFFLPIEDDTNAH